MAPAYEAALKTVEAIVATTVKMLEIHRMSGETKGKEE